MEEGRSNKVRKLTLGRKQMSFDRFPQSVDDRNDSFSKRALSNFDHLMNLSKHLNVVVENDEIELSTANFIESHLHPCMKGLNSDTDNGK